jgi:adenine-specific DNA-methyltransferase
MEKVLLPRLKAVIAGNESAELEPHPGGFRYYKIAPSLLEKDRWGNWIISSDYNSAMLAEAVCKLMGFTYAPSDEHYWMHGRSSENDFIYVTTQSLTHEQLKSISEDVGEERTLLICCKAFRANLDALPNLTVRKIPQTVLRKCEWGKDDYSLVVASLPIAVPQELEREPIEKPQKERRVSAGQEDLFARAAK